MAKWKATTIQLGNNAKAADIRDKVQLINELKDRLAQLEKDNETLAGENEELRQFSMDGYEIAKNVQQLSGEREKLSVDLADKAQTIRRLLAENESLNTKLHSAQKNASEMLKSAGGASQSNWTFSSPAIK